MNAILETVTLFAVSLLVPAAAGQQDSMSMAKAQQADAPLQMTRVMFNDTSLTVLLVNVTDQEVKQVSVGVVLADKSSAVSPVTRIGTVCEATVPPGGFLVVRGANFGFDTAASYFRDKGITEKEATIGVTHVSFASGIEWTYPLEAKGRFEEHVSEALRQKVASLDQKQFPAHDVSWAMLGPGLEGKVSTCRKLTDKPIPAKVKIPD